MTHKCAEMKRRTINNQFLNTPVGLSETKFLNPTSNTHMAKFYSIRRWTFFLLLLSLLFAAQYGVGQTLTISSSFSLPNATSGTNWTLTGDNTGRTLTFNKDNGNDPANVHPNVITNALADGPLTIIGPSNIDFNNTGISLASAISSTSEHALTFGGPDYGGTLNFNATISIGGALNIYGGRYTNTQNVTLTGANNDLLVKCSDYINITGGTTTTNGGDQIYWADCKGNGSPVAMWLSLANINTNGGHVWAGGGGQSATWNGLTVGSKPIVQNNTDAPTVRIRGNINTTTTANTSIGGDVLMLGGSNRTNGGGADIAPINSSVFSITSGNGDITLLTRGGDHSYGGYTFSFSTTGSISFGPASGLNWDPLAWNTTNIWQTLYGSIIWPVSGTVSGSDFVGSGGLAGIIIKNYSGVGGLYFGTYPGTGVSGDDAYVSSNTQAIRTGSEVSLGGSVTIQSGNFTTNASSPISTTGGITVNASGNVTLNAALNGSTETVNVLGNLQTNGSLTNVNLTGSGDQSITGTADITNLTLNKTGGTATVSAGPQNITGVLTLTAGSLAAGGNLVLKSNIAGTARVAQHGPGSGTVTGSVVVEKFIDVEGRPKQWRTLGYPYSADMAMSLLSGFSIDYNEGRRSAMYFNEGAADDKLGGGTVQRNAGYVSFTDPSETLKAGKGIMAWVYGNSGGSANAIGNLSGTLTVRSSGTLNESGDDVSMPVTYTASNPDRGWNLLSNPFASAIDWGSEAITKTNVTDAIYRWNPIADNWTTWSGGVGTTEGATSIIESGGSFFVKAIDASPVLTIPQSAKTDATGTSSLHFRTVPRNTLQSRSVPSPNRLAGIRVSVKGQGNPHPDAAYLDLSREDATSGFDLTMDAVSMGRASGAGVAFMDAKDNFYAIQFDAPIEETGVEKRNYPLKVTSPTTGETTIEIWPSGAWSPLNSVTLIDKKEGKTILLEGGRITYPFTMTTLKEESRFVIAINHVKVDGFGKPSAFDLRLLGNPVTDGCIDLLVAHPNAKAKRWTIVDNSGKTIGAGGFGSGDAGLQYRLTVPAMRLPGVYFLHVVMDNGQERTVRVVRN